MHRRQFLFGLSATAVVLAPASATAAARRRRKRVVRGMSGNASTTRSVTQDGDCSCNSGKVCVGPRGGRYCISRSGNKRYGV